MSGQVGQIDGGCKIAAKGCICNSTIRRINLRIKVQNRQGDVYPPDPVNASVINNIIKRLAAGPGDIVPGFAAARTAYEVRTKINVGTDSPVFTKRGCAGYPENISSCVIVGNGLHSAIQHGRISRSDMSPPLPLHICDMCFSSHREMLVRGCPYWSFPQAYEQTGARPTVP